MQLLMRSKVLVKRWKLRSKESGKAYASIGYWFMSLRMKILFLYLDYFLILLRHNLDNPLSYKSNVHD